MFVLPNLLTLLADVVSHPDDKDMTCLTGALRQKARCLLERLTEHFPDYPSLPLSGLRIGLPVEAHLAEPNLQLPASLLEHFRSLGATLHAVSLPNLPMALPAYYVLASAEASSNLGRYGGGWFGSSWEKESTGIIGEETGDARRRRIRTAGFGTEVKKRILAGAYALSAE